MARMEVITHAQATVGTFSRQGGIRLFDYQLRATRAGPLEAVGITEAMTVMRNPSVLDQMEWSTCKHLRSTDAIGPRYVITGRCTIAQRAYPLPGLAGIGLELV